MDLKFNGQYRMVEISKFNFTCNSVGDIMLVPTIMEKLYQIQVTSYYNYDSIPFFLTFLKAIISETLQSLYNSFDDIEESEDTTSFVATACGSPIAMKIIIIKTTRIELKAKDEDYNQSFIKHR